MIKASVTGSDAIAKKIADIPAEFAIKLAPVVAQAGFRVQRTAKKSIQASPPGGSSGRSKPGNPPKTDTGRLVNSIFMDLRKRKDKIEAVVGTAVKYGAWLEFGTRHIAARPWLAPAYRVHAKRNAQAIKNAIRKALGK